jgi:hypothetical protein
MISKFHLFPGPLKGSGKGGAKSTFLFLLCKNQINLSIFALQKSKVEPNMDPNLI